MPAVVYDVGGLGEIVGAYGAGRVVPAGDIDGLAAAIDELLGDDGSARPGARRRCPRARRAHLGARLPPLTWPSTRSSCEAFGGEAASRSSSSASSTLFATDEASLLGEADEAEAAWNRVGRDESEEAYGDYQLVVDAIADRLLDIRETYRRTLRAEPTSEYAAAFTKAATRRFRRYATLLADLDD